MADPERVKEEIENVLAIPAEDAVLASARQGVGTREILERVVREVPPPSGDPDAPLRALIFDSHYDQYLGVVAYVRIVDGRLRRGDRIRMMSSSKEFEVTAVGYFRPEMLEGPELSTGEVGWVTASMKQVGDARVGDTITLAGSAGAREPLPGYKRAKPMVSCGLYPMNSEDYPDLREALEKLQLNDASLSWEPETSAALGFGFRCGFLGLLHMDIIQERLEREFGLDIIATAPGVVYRVHKTDGTVEEVDNPSKLPPVTQIAKIEEPFVTATIIVPSEYLGGVMELCQDRRGTFEHMEYSGTTRVIITYKLPLAEILMDFYDQLKSRTRGYASFDYEMAGFQESKVVKLDILLNGQPVDALSFITHQDRAYARGRMLVDKLRDILPRQLFEIRVQAAIGQKIIAASSIRPLRKNVTAKCYGGDITRKRKLLEKQKEGKKRMKQIGSVEVPQEAFLSVLKLGGD
jgi:GTP-binding protein LepA